MVTGDQVAIAQETAKTLGMGSDILDASSLGDVKRKESEAASDAIEAADGFARCSPSTSSTFVDVLQKRGHMVGMTGDGSTTPRRSRRPIAHRCLDATTPHGRPRHRADDPGLS